MAIITQQRASTSSNDEGAQFLFKKDPITGNYPQIDNANPELTVSALLPVAISPIKLVKLGESERGSSAKMLELAQKIGFEIQHLEFAVYGKNKQGKARYLSNSELVQGYPMYGESNAQLDIRLKSLMNTRTRLIGFTKLLKGEAEKFSEPVKLDEWDDADKLTIQRTQFYGRFLGPPASETLIDVKYPPRFLEILDKVCQHYIKSTESLMPDRLVAMAAITDAKETAIGGPSFASSGADDQQRGYHEKRLITLADMPVPDYTDDAAGFLSEAYLWGESLGMPDGSMTFASALSYRQGAKGHKPQLLWYFNGSEFAADYQAYSLESNQRKVYPAPHCFNVLISPIVYQMKTFRKMKLGMYHSPEFVGRYIKALNDQGPISYESDFSSFDTTISNQILKFVFQRLAVYSSKYKWEYNLFADYLATTGVISPNYLSDDPRMVTYFSKAVSLLSGILPTSESGSIVSVSANLYALEAFDKEIVNNWIANKFTILVQSDDVLFTWPKAIDEQVFSDRMSECYLGAKLKQGNMFLKKLLPVGTLSKFVGKFPLAGVPLWSRQPLQTFFNEHSYEGKPDAIVRLALLSRAEGLNKHPMFSKVLDDAWKDILNDFPIFRPVVPVLYDGVLALSAEDKAEVLKYSLSEDGMAWVSQIYNRAESDPKAKLTLLELEKIGFHLADYEDTAISQRRSYIQALFNSPTTESRKMMSSILAWNVG